MFPKMINSGVSMQFNVKLSLTLIAAAAAMVACSKKDAPAPVPAAAPASVPVATVATGATVVKIGHVSPTSGGSAHLGKDNENGARLAIEELNTAGVMLDGKKVTLELMVEDDASDPKQGTAVAQKLVDAKVAGVIGHLNSGTTIPASKLYSDAGIPQISPSATNPKYTRQGFKTAFRVVADDVHLGSTLGKYAVNTLKGKSIAVIDDRTAYGQGVADEFTKAVEAAGVKVIAKEFTTDKATDFSSILTTIKAKKPDVVFFGGMDAVAGPMLKQMKSLGIKARFMGGDGICTTELPKLAGDAMADEQVFCAEAGGVEGEAKAGLEEFKTKYKAKFNMDVQLYSPYVYDATKVLVAAMVKANSSDPAKYLPALAATADFKGVTGPITFDEKGDIKNGALTLMTFKGGQRSTLAVVR
jgi:branched-chain amino acid transport system substrate-binding protein